MIGVLAVGMTMIEEAEGVVESLAIGHAGRARRPEPPFADHGRAVAGITQHLCDRDIFGPQRNVAVSADPRVAGVHPGHQRRPRRGAHRAARVVLRKADAFAREAIERRRGKSRLSVCTEIAVPEVVGLNEQHIRTRWFLLATPDGCVADETGSEKNHQRHVRTTTPDSFLHLRIVIEAKRSVLGRGQERTSLLFIGAGDDDLDHPEAVDGEPVSLPQRFASQLAGDTGGGQKSLNLLRLDLAARREHADLILHTDPLDSLCHAGNGTVTAFDVGTSSRSTIENPHAL